MPAYQFYKRMIEDQNEFGCLCTDHDQFLANRELLLAQGFEVVGFMIFAPNETKAIARFNEDRTSPYFNNTVADTILVDTYYFIKNLTKSICNRTKNKI
ncbi:hypothetical protein HQ393_16080 [Chitinibacter bivalviorum]|uniref:Uncharacterized protein n=1 Tax=Chitinibacter bivalviorum TaxID=2739434 RepID=A0A7H9BMH8_9NEIS|nr:hypothetical protein [Chitinibacter bivalviorum]QLG89642.1 hypothetical protein HQ393_16080 [Chitinibacter bivalviorum]